jgi:tetratricopeptide (TPR) repeat protein
VKQKSSFLFWLSGSVVAVALLLLCPASARSSSLDLQVVPSMLNGSMNDAIRLLKERTQQAPNDAEAYHLLSRAYYELEDWDNSIHAAERAVQLDPQSSEYHLWLGRAYGNKAERSSWFTALMLARKTRTEFEKAVQLDAANVDARSDLAEYYMEAPGFLGGGTDKARAEAGQLSAYNAAAAYWVTARLSEKAGNLSDAEQQYRKAIEASSDPGGEWLNLASFYRHQKRYPEMESAIQQAVAYQKKKSNVLFDAADMLYRAGRNFPGAAQLVKMYIASHHVQKDDPPTFQAHYLLGEILEKQGDKKGAADEYRAALAQASDYRQAQKALERVTH